MEVKMIKIIAAVSSNGVIGITENGIPKIPWNHPADMKYFREITKHSNIIFGRKTFESIGKALPNRRNIVVSSRQINIEKIEVFDSLENAIKETKTDMSPTWIAGGSRIYEEGMAYAEEIHLTVTSDVIRHAEVVRFPWINPRMFEIKECTSLTGDLKLYFYQRI